MVAVGPATGIINGFGAGGGGIVAGALVGGLLAATGTYFAGFTVLGLAAIAGGIALAIYVRITSQSDKRNAHQTGTTGSAIR